jgi:hypothetical protein
MNMWSVNTRPKASVSSAGGCFELLVLVIAIWVNVGLSYSGDTILPLPHLDVACVVLTDQPRLAGVSPWNRRPRHIGLGTGTSNIAFVDPNSLSVTGGSGTATVTANAGTNTFTAGAGSLDVTGGSGSDTYVFHTGSGLLTIEDFSADTGDKLVLDSALQASMVQSSDNQGGTLITFGSGATQAIDLRGVGAVPNGAIAWA